MKIKCRVWVTRRVHSKKQDNSHAKKPNGSNGPQEEHSEKEGNSQAKKPNENNGPQEECRKKQGNSQAKTK